MKKFLFTFRFGILIFICLYTASNTATAQSGNWTWQRFGTLTCSSEGTGTYTDPVGNVYIIGEFGCGTISFDATHSLTNTGTTFTIYIVKYDPSGNVLWARTAAGTSVAVEGLAITGDVSGNIYVTGDFSSPSVTFGAFTLTNTKSAGGNADVFIVKYDASGNVRWAKSGGGGNGNVIGNSVSADPSGNIYLTGYFASSTLSFAGVGTLINTGNYDVFTAKYDTNGNILWARSAAGNGKDVATSISADASGNAYITGYFGSPSITFGSSSLPNAGVQNMFIVKYDAVGNVVWARSAGGNGALDLAAGFPFGDQGNSISVDGNGNPWVAGCFTSATFSCSSSVALTNSHPSGGSGFEDGFVVKYDQLGNALLAKSIAGSSGDIPWSISANNSRVYVASRFASPSLTLGSITITNPPGSYEAMFIVDYDLNGNVVYALPRATGGDDMVTISVNNSGDVYVSGDDTGPGASAEYVFVTKYVNYLCNGIYDYVVPPAGGNSSAMLTAIGTGGTITGKNILVQGTLTIDVLTNCSNCTFVMYPGAKIDLTGGNFTLNGQSHVFACTDMWDGIYVEPGKTLNILGSSLVEDALNAVVSVGGGTFIIDEAIFNKNLTAIDVRAYSGGTHPGTITNSIVTSRVLPANPTVAGLKTGSTLTSYPTSVLKSPLIDRKGCYGINVTDVTNINIGSASAASKLNIFDWIMCGINLTRSNAVIYNNQFQNLLGYNLSQQTICLPPPAPCYSSYYSNGIGIQANGTATGTNSVTIGGTLANQPNIFYNTNTAMFFQNYQNHFISNNSIDNATTGPFGTKLNPVLNYGKYGIFVTSPTANNIVWINNHTLIGNCETAVYVNRNIPNALNTLQLNILNNTITASTGYCTNGIYVADLLNGASTPPNGWSISNNTISQTGNCINLINVKNPNPSTPYFVTNNLCTVRYATTGSINGILTNGCANIQITTNHTKYNNVGGLAYTTGGNPLACGIYIESSQNMLVKCNTMDDAARNLVFKGACTSVLTTNSFPAIGVTQNIIHRAQDGFVLLTNGIIGTQGSGTVASNNTWDVPANYLRGQTVVEGSGTDAANSKLYANAALLPTSNFFITPGIAYSPTSLISSSGSPAACDPGRSLATPLNDPNTATTALTAYASELKAMVDDVSKLPVLSDETHWLRKQFVYHELKNNAALQSSNTSLQNFYTSTKYNYAKFASVDDKIVIAQYAQANTINNSIITSNAIESNQQTVNTLVLQKLLAPGYIYTKSDINTLNNIATQCPLSGGNSVYQARVLLMTIANNVIEFVDNCPIVTGGTRSLEETSVTSNTSIENESFKLYPNPNDGNMIFEYSLSIQSTGTFVLYDITGRAVNKYALQQGENKQLQINENELKGGIYFYNVIIDNTVKAYNKIVIVK